MSNTNNPKNQSELKPQIDSQTIMWFSQKDFEEHVQLFGKVIRKIAEKKR